MNKLKEVTCYIEQDILLMAANEHECQQQILLSTIMDVFDDDGAVVIEKHYVNAPIDTVGVYFNVDNFMARYRNVFNKINL